MSGAAVRLAAQVRARRVVMRMSLLAATAATLTVARSSAADPGGTALRRATQTLTAGEFDRAIAICHGELRPDSANAALRALLVQAYTMRDRVCFPVPPTREAFVAMEEGNERCEVSFVPAATRDTIAAVIAVEEMLAQDARGGGGRFLRVDHELRFGTPAALARELDRLLSADSAAVGRHLLTQFPSTLRPAMLRVAAGCVLATSPRPLPCEEAARLTGAFMQAADWDGVRAVLAAVPGDSSCVRQLSPLVASVLVISGGYRELWDLMRTTPREAGPIEYYRSMLTGALAAAHFDPGLARERLEFERVNEEAYPEPARLVLTDLRAILGDSAATGEAWEALAAHDLLASEQFRDVRFLLHSLALRRNPRLTTAGTAMATDLIGRGIPLAAARVYEELAGGRRPELDRRWDPRRPEYLRLAAAYYFKAEDDAACRAALAAIDEPAPEDDLLGGAAALRVGETVAAHALLQRAVERAPLGGMAQTATELLGFGAEGAR